jgi:hypothetical protein
MIFENCSEALCREELGSAGKPIALFCSESVLVMELLFTSSTLSERTQISTIKVSGVVCQCREVFNLTSVFCRDVSFSTTEVRVIRRSPFCHEGLA